MTSVTVINPNCIKVEMKNTQMEAETYWIDLHGVYKGTNSPIVYVSVSRKNGGIAQLNSNRHQTRIGRVCSVARNELQAYVKAVLDVRPDGGFHRVTA